MIAHYLKGDDMNATALAARAHDFQESGDWGGAAKCYEEMLDAPLSALDRAKTLANLMQMYDKLGKKENALNAGLRAMELIGIVPDDNSELWHLRGYVRGYVYRLQGRPGPGLADTGRGLDPDKGCFIATAVFGSADASEIAELRAWRDRRLMPSPIGRFLVSFYYVVSPRIVPFVEYARLKTAARFLLRRFIVLLYKLKRI
jgi:tetratricopeptide (TPR) repeat protein